MSYFLYTYDSVTNKPRVSSTSIDNVLLANGSVGLSASWSAGAHQIQVSIDPSGSNDLTRKSRVESQISAITGPFGSTHSFAGQANGADPVGISVGSRFLVTTAYSTYTAGQVIEHISLVPAFAAASVVNGDVYVAQVTLPNSASVTSDTSIIDQSEITVWNSTSSQWVTVGSIVAIPDATSATKGAVSININNGLDIAAGVLGVNIDTSDLGFRISGDTGSIYVKESGIDHASLNNLNSASYTHLSSTNATDLTDGGDSTLHYHSADRARSAHSGTQLASTISDFDEAAMDAAAAMITSGSHTAIAVAYNDVGNAYSISAKYNNTTIGVNGSNQLEVKANSLTGSQLGSVIVANEGLKQTVGALGVDYDNVTIGIVSNKLATLASGELSIPYTNNTGVTLSANTVVALSKTVTGEIVKADASDDDLADAEGVIKADILTGATGRVIVKGNVTVTTDGNNFDLGKWVYVAGGASAGKASKLVTGSYRIVKLGKATATNKVSIEKQWIG